MKKRIKLTIGFRDEGEKNALKDDALAEGMKTSHYLKHCVREYKRFKALLYK